MDNHDVKVYVTNKLKAFGITANLLGYEYIRHATMLCVDNGEYLHKIVKRLYPALAEKYGVRASNVERAIRHAIEVAYSRGNINELNAVFACITSPSKGQPTNKEFIATLADSIKMDLKIA